MRSGGGTVAVRLSPQNASRAGRAGDPGRRRAAGHPGHHHLGRARAGQRQALNLKSFIADLDVPVIVGGCTNYQTAIHLMRTGAAGVIVGTGDGATATTDDVLGIAVPMATAIADAAAARRAYLDETGGRYVHVIAAGGIALQRRHRQGDRLRRGRRDARRAARPWSAGGARRRLVLADQHGTPGACRAGSPPRAAPPTCRWSSCCSGPAVGADGRTNLFGALAPGDGQGRLLRPEGVPEGRAVRPDVSLRRPARPGPAPAVAGGTRSRLPLCAGTRHTASPTSGAPRGNVARR